MKKLTSMFVSAALMINIMTVFNTFGAVQEQSAKSTYCALMKNGKLKVMKDGIEIPADVTLENGVIITKDATVIEKNGSKRALTNGECVDKDGNILMPEEKKKK